MYFSTRASGVSGPSRVLASARYANPGTDPTLGKMSLQAAARLARLCWMKHQTLAAVGRIEANTETGCR